MKESSRRYRASLRVAVFDHYGWACACCGSTKRPTIDHVNGDGREHRRELFGSNQGGNTFNLYRWLIASGFPGGFQTLCSSCNASKRDHDHCRLNHQESAIEGAPPATRLAPAASHPDAIWNTGEQLTDEQRQAIVARAHALVGTPYDYAAYIGFALEITGLRTGQQLEAVFRHDTWRVCSADVADAYGFAGIDLTAGLKVPNLVSPADLYDRIARQGGAAGVTGLSTRLSSPGPGGR